MCSEKSRNFSSRMLVIFLTILSVCLIYLVASGRNQTIGLIASDQMILICLYLLGLAMCATGGMSKTIHAYGWLHPVSLAGSLLGIIAVVMTAAVLLHTPLPIIHTERDAFILLAILITIKLGINLGTWFIHRIKLT